MNVEEILGEDTYTVIFRLMQFCDYIINKNINDEDEEMVTFSVLDFNIEIDRVNDVICMIKDEIYQNGLYD